MEQRHKDLIRCNYLDLASNISSNITDLTKDLWRRKLISESMHDNVLIKPQTNKERAYALLELIPKRGASAFETFYTSCLAMDLFDAADILKPENAPHGPSILPATVPEPQKKGKSAVGQNMEDTESDEEPLPEVWPPEIPPDLRHLKVIRSDSMDDKKKKSYRSKYKKAMTPQGQEMNYLMKHEKKALVFIISNERFEKLSNRDGTKLDMKGLRQLFQNLGCQVKTVEDKTHKEMWEELEKLKETDFSKYDCLMVFILTHGHKDVVFGKDGYITQTKGDGNKETPHNYLKVSDITDLFCSVDKLNGKPKLFFFQACRGSQKDDGKFMTDGGDCPTDRGEPPAPPSPPPSPKPVPDGGDEKADGALDYLSADMEDSTGAKIPSRADVFVAMATTPDNVSWRKPNFGTWFIQAIIYVFARYAYRNELHELMTKVNRLIVKAETTKGGFKQVMEKTDTFHKKFFFFPGFDEKSETDTKTS